MGAAQVSGAELSLGPLLNWASAVALLLALGTSIWTILGSSSRNNGRRIDDLGKRYEAIEHRVSALEQTLRTMPGKDDLHAVTLALADIRGDLKMMNAQMESTNKIMQRLEHNVGRHDEHLTRGGAK